MPCWVAPARPGCSKSCSAGICSCCRTTVRASGSATTDCCAKSCCRPSSGARRPTSMQGLHARAAAWFEEHGESEDAIDHAVLGRRPGAFGRLVLGAMQPIWASGQIETGRGLDGTAGQSLARAAHAGDDRPRSIDLRSARPARRLRAVGRGRRVASGDGHAARRQHGGGDAGLLAGEPVPARPGHDAAAMRSKRWTGSAPPAPTAPRCSTPRASRICSRATSTEPTRRSPMPTTSPRASRARPSRPWSSPSRS